MLVPILKDTWGNDAGDSIRYYSELEDTVAGTTSLGIANTETGIAAYTHTSTVYMFFAMYVHYMCRSEAGDRDTRAACSMHFLKA